MRGRRKKRPSPFKEGEGRFKPIVSCVQGRSDESKEEVGNGSVPDPAPDLGVIDFLIRIERPRFLEQNVRRLRINWI